MDSGALMDVRVSDPSARAQRLDDRHLHQRMKHVKSRIFTLRPPSTGPMLRFVEIPTTGVIDILRSGGKNRTYRLPVEGYRGGIGTRD